MTYHRAAMSGYLVVDACPLCGARGDTMQHRIWRCTHPAAVAARNAVAPQWLQQEESRRPANESFWVSGFICHPGDVWPTPAANPQAHCQFGTSGDRAPGDDDGTHTSPKLKGSFFWRRVVHHSYLP